MCEFLRIASTMFTRCDVTPVWFVMTPTQRPCKSCHVDSRNTSSPKTTCAGGSAAAAHGAVNAVTQSSMAGKRRFTRLNKFCLGTCWNDVRLVRPAEELVYGCNAGIG